MVEKSVSIIESIDRVNRNKWNNLISQADLGTVFHRYGWLKAIEKGFGANPRHIIIEKGDNPVAVFPNFYDSIEVPVAKDLISSAPVRELNSVSPGFGGPVIGGNEEDCLEMMFEAIEEISDIRTVYHWIRTSKLGFVRYGQALTDRGYTPITTSCRFRVDLTRPWEEIWNEMDNDCRRRIRNMDDHDVEYRDEPITTQTIEEFYEKHTRNLERKGTEPYTISFYKSLAEQMGHRLKITTVLVDGTDRGTFLYLLDEERSTVHYYLAGIDSEEHFEYNPSQLLHTHTMEWAHERDYQYFDFGSTRANQTNGVFRHKEAYGGELIPSLHWRKGLSPVGWPAFVTAQKLIRKTRV